MIADNNVCLSMLISGRREGEPKTLTVPDCWAWAVEHENDECEMPPLVREALRIAALREEQT
jgi:hypothetical protein